MLSNGNTEKDRGTGGNASGGAANSDADKAKRKQKIEILILIILLPIFIYLLMTTFFKPPKKQAIVPALAVPAASENVIRTAGSIATSQPAQPAVREDAALTKDWGDNPFVPRSTKSTGASVGELKLQGIVLEGGGKPYAIISERIVAAGESVGEYTVQEIQKNRVILINKEGKEIVLEG
jgi:hypothetical protein